MHPSVRVYVRTYVHVRAREKERPKREVGETESKIISGPTDRAEINRANVESGRSEPRSDVNAKP